MATATRPRVATRGRAAVAAARPAATAARGVGVVGSAASSSSSTSSSRVAVRRAAAPSLLSSRRASSRGSALVPTAIASPPASSPATEDAAGEPSSYDWHNQWYPVAFVADLVDDAPFTFTLLGEPLVFWKDKTTTTNSASGGGTYRCTADKCPHRLVPLSEGRVNDAGEIEVRSIHWFPYDRVGVVNADP
jgi:nitrite reductase/ring-hydroxylating ferredoxin subunit